MKDFKGTKGKWTKEGIDVFSVQNKYNEIAQAYSSSENSISEYTDEDWREAHANAQLIAAAPELLEALQDLIYTSTRLWNEVSPIKSTDTILVTHPIIENAKYAINKALGKEDSHE